VQRLDVVIADAAMLSALSVRAFGRLLRITGTAFVAALALARQCGAQLPSCVGGAPMLLPRRGRLLRSPVLGVFR
jgi:hypothetical protein